nr:ABC transporter substrate-binding protein [uncultured Lichenicoccus sp.]
MDRRRFLATIPVALAASPLLGRPARAAGDSLSVLLDWFINPDQAPLVIAQQIGAFGRQGLSVDLVQPADPTMPPRLVAAGHGDIAIGYQTVLYRQVLGNLPILRIGALQDRSLVSLCVLKSGGIKQIADFKGKRIAYNDVGGDVFLACLDAMLRSAGLSLGDVTTVNVGTALTTALLTGRVDATPVVRNFEPFEIAQRGETPICFDFENYGTPPSDGFVFEVQRDRVGDPRFPRFLAAIREATAFIRAKPGDAWALFLKAYPDLDDSLNKQAWDYTIPYFAVDPAALDTHKYQVFADFLTARKVIGQSPPLASYAKQLGYPRT